MFKSLMKMELNTIIQETISLVISVKKNVMINNWNLFMSCLSFFAPNYAKEY